MKKPWTRKISLIARCCRWPDPIRQSSVGGSPKRIHTADFEGIGGRVYRDTYSELVAVRIPTSVSRYRHLNASVAALCGLFDA